MSWICKDCGSINDDSLTECEVCGCCEHYVPPAEAPVLEHIEGMPVVLSRDEASALSVVSDSITVPDRYTVIGPDAFADRTDFKTVILPNSIVEIRDRAFKNCTSLLSVVYFGSLRRIEAEAFYNCTALAFRLSAEYVASSAFEKRSTPSSTASAASSSSSAASSASTRSAPSSSSSASSSSGASSTFDRSSRPSRPSRSHSSRSYDASRDGRGTSAICRTVNVFNWLNVAVFVLGIIALIVTRVVEDDDGIITIVLPAVAGAFALGIGVCQQRTKSIRHWRTAAVDYVYTAASVLWILICFEYDGLLYDLNILDFSVGFYVGATILLAVTIADTFIRTALGKRHLVHHYAFYLITVVCCLMQIILDYNEGNTDILAFTTAMLALVTIPEVLYALPFYRNGRTKWNVAGTIIATVLLGIRLLRLTPLLWGANGLDGIYGVLMDFGTMVFLFVALCAANVGPIGKLPAASLTLNVVAAVTNAVMIALMQLNIFFTNVPLLVFSVANFVYARKRGRSKKMSGFALIFTLVTALIGFIISVNV